MNKTLTNLLFVLCLCIALFSGYKVIQAVYVYYENGKIISEAQDAFTIEDTSVEAEPEGFYEKPDFTVDFESLLSQNNEVIGWIWLRDSNINMPVVMGKDNEKYIHTSYNGVYNSLGSIFADYRCNPDFSSRNTVIYGHNGKNQSMFGNLKNFPAQEYYLEHPCFYIFTPEGKIEKYLVYSSYVTRCDSDAYTISFADDAAFEQFLQTTASLSMIQTDVHPTVNDTVITLSTCTNGKVNDRFVVHAIKEK